MKTGFIIKHAVKVFCLMFAVSVMPLFSLAQSKKAAPPPPPPPNKPVQPAPRTPPPGGFKPPVAMHGPGPQTPGKGPTGALLRPDLAVHGPGKEPVTTKGPDGGKIVTTPGGAEAHYAANGQLRTVKTASGITITHGPGGTRQVVTERRGANNALQSRIVSTGSNRGYVEHTFQRGGHDYMRRTYVYSGHTYVNVYRGSYYHGVIYYHYVPAYYYHPMFYGWAYNPWPAPVYYAWGWNTAPWYTPYGYYFSPYPAYPSAAFWLTDYMIAEPPDSFDGRRTGSCSSYEGHRLLYRAVDSE